VAIKWERFGDSNMYWSDFCELKVVVVFSKEECLLDVIDLEKRQVSIKSSFSSSETDFKKDSLIVFYKRLNVLREHQEKGERANEIINFIVPEIERLETKKTAELFLQTDCPIFKDWGLKNLGEKK